MSFAEIEEVKPQLVPAPMAIRLLSRCIDTCVIGIGGALAVLIFINVVLHALSRDLAWLTELGEFLMVWVTFLGGAAAAQRGAHMSINEFLDKLSPPKRRWADAAVQAFCALIMVVILYYGLRIVDESWGTVLTTLEWPMAWQYMPLPVGSACILVFLLWDLVLILRGVPREQRYPAD
ncbi:TRAP transporter small permease [Rhodoferax sp.]|uniref:TRAP transporter small permease n=1 Tax=Rhodoferax sp. TaxID=50421 RepID=UPI0025FBE464|nr:TRAP transporter small permease [Rhodoferax sp.]